MGTGSQFLLWNVPGIPKTAQERRIFDLVPRRKRSHRGPRKELPDFSRVPRKKRTGYSYTSNTTVPKWLLRLKIEMKLHDHPILLIKKPLDLTDVHPYRNCLSLPFRSLERNDFLTCDEWKILGDGTINKDGKIGVAAFLVDQRMKQWNVILKKWILTTVSGANGLREGDNISLWAFRRHGILFFALGFAGNSIDFLE